MSQEIDSKGDFPELPKQNSVALVLETRWHRFGQRWIFLGDFWWKSFFEEEKARVKFRSCFKSVYFGFGFFQGFQLT
jgi:hypothetical protein